jgi:SdpC family antimicrobial peptide
MKIRTTCLRMDRGVAVALVLALLSALVGVTPSNAQAPRHDGATLFRGLFFGTGPIAAQIPTIRKVAPHLPVEYRQLEDQVVRHLQTQDPNFFPQFAKELQSGDHVRVAKELRRARQLNVDAVLALTKNSQSDFAKALRQHMAEERAGTSKVGRDTDNVAVVAVAVAAVAVIVVFFLWAKPPVDAEFRGLTFERYVDEIVRTLRPA